MSSDGTNFQKVTAVAAGTGVVTLAATTTIDEDAMWEVKQTVDASGNYSYTFYNVGKKAYLKLTSGSTTYNSGIEEQGYTGGFVLVAAGTNTALSQNGNVAATLATLALTDAKQLFGLYDAGSAPYTNTELAALENGAFSMTIAIDKDNVGKKTIKGADVFAGSLTPVAASANVTRFQLKDADGKYIVLAKKQAWGVSDLNGTSNRGLKFVKVAAADKDKADYYSWFEIGYPMVTGKTYELSLIHI